MGDGYVKQTLLETPFTSKASEKEHQSNIPSYNLPIITKNAKDVQPLPQKYIPLLGMQTYNLC